MKHLLLSLLGHMQWADAIVAKSLQRGAVPDPEAARLFAHIAAAEHLWLSRIDGRAPTYAVWPDSMTPAQSGTLASEHADLFTQLVGAATPADLARIIAYRNSAGREFRSSVSDIVTHVAMHGSYHRGQIARRLRSVGQEPPYTDFIQFTRRDQ